MLLQVLGGIATLITTIFAALGLALGVPAEASSSETSSLGSSELGTLTNPALTSLPASARVATPEEVDEILATEWETPHTPVVFREASENFRSKPEATHTAIFRVCNRNWVDLVVDREAASYKSINHASTLAGCSAFFRYKERLDSAYAGAIAQGSTFYVGDENTVYLAGPKGAVKLTRVN